MPLYAFSNTNPVHEAVWRKQLAGVLGSFGAMTQGEFRVQREVYTSCGLGLRKPDRSGLPGGRRSDMHGVDPGSILFVDDNADNVAGARAAGLRAWHATSPESTGSMEMLKSLIR